MPNYVKNIVTITATKEHLENLLNEVKSEDSCFDFNKIINMIVLFLDLFISFIVVASEIK